MVTASAAVHRGEIWWADLPEPRGPEPGFRRPVLVIQADAFNRSRVQTIIVAVITSNVDLRHRETSSYRRAPRACRAIPSSMCLKC